MRASIRSRTPRPGAWLFGLTVPLFALAALAPTSGCSSTTEATPSGITCKPGVAVFCRCQDREEGSKICNEDGKSFGKCEPCESIDNPVIPDEPGETPVEVDAGDPAKPRCGDKIVQDGEDCDDGNRVDDDGCSDGCKLAGQNPLASRSCPGLDVHVWSDPVAYTGTTVGSTNTAASEPACKDGAETRGSTAADRIFKVTAHRAGTLKVLTSENSYDSFLYVSASCTPDDNGRLVHLACANKSTGLGDEAVSIPVEKDKTYTVVVDGAGLTQKEGSFKVTFAIE